jgi:pimeloyl-ACP methyl ester carboxylesterase
MAAMTTRSIKIDGDIFDVTVLQPASAVRCVLFAAGRGGNPTRHLALMQTLAAHGASVIAPHFEMLASLVPAKAELMKRSQRLAAAMNSYCSPDLPISGVGHSIGTVLLLMLAGAVASTFAGDQLTFRAERAFDRLVLFTPPTDFFRRPGALAEVKIPLQVWAGGKDTITPPAQARFLKAALAGQTQVDIHIVEDAGHFTFMNDLPPNVSEPHPDRVPFLQSLGEQVSRFLAA